MFEHVSKHLAVAAERFRASLGLVWVRWVLKRLLSGGVNVTMHAATDTKYRENTI